MMVFIVPLARLSLLHAVSNTLHALGAKRAGENIYRKKQWGKNKHKRKRGHSDHIVLKTTVHAKERNPERVNKRERKAVMN